MSERSPTQRSTGGPPSAPPSPLHARATAWLFGATLFWGLSFPLAKALAIAQYQVLPGADSWFLSATILVVRFGVAGIMLALVSARTLRTVSRREWSQGIGLAGFASGGLLLQMDGLNYTAASTTAFLTSCYCVIIPLFVAVQRRRWPSAVVVGCCALVLAGMSVLSGLDWHTLRLGRGEWENVLASFFFAGQIFWVERPVYLANRTSHATVVMFAGITLAMLPVLLWRAPSVGDFARAAAGSGAIVGLLLGLVVFCTLLAFTVMNHWQRHIEATEAGLIYCLEPVIASGLALFLPGWLSAWTGAPYPNEHFTWSLLLGGALITAANVGIQLRPKTPPAPAVSQAGATPPVSEAE